MASVPIIDADANPDRDPMVYGLAARRSETAGLIVALKERLAKAETDLSTLDATLLMYGVEKPAQCIRTKKAATAGLFHPKELPRLVRDAMRAKPDGISSAEIARNVMAAKLWEADERLESTLVAKVTRLLCEWARQRRVERKADASGIRRWERAT